jgi:hypothetical protein
MIIPIQTTNIADDTAAVEMMRQMRMEAAMVRQRQREQTKANADDCAFANSS